MYSSYEKVIKYNITDDFPDSVISNLWSIFPDGDSLVCKLVLMYITEFHFWGACQLRKGGGAAMEGSSPSIRKWHSTGLLVLLKENWKSFQKIKQKAYNLHKTLNFPGALTEE